jgi:tRNA(fMet)-specific endonuclease VapC
VALILDTNALSAAADREPSALAIVSGADSIAVPVIVLGEYRFGIAQSRHRASYENWLQEWISSVIVLDIDEETSQSYATLGLELRRKGRPIPTNDLWIAALCRQHALPIVSRDQHFDLVPGIRRLSW